MSPRFLLPFLALLPAGLLSQPAASPAPGTAAGTPSAPAAPAAADPFAEPLVKTIAEVSAKAAPSAADYARIADRSLDFLQRKAGAGEKFAPNVVHSGLDAVDAGEAANPKAADWPKLRQELQTFLEKPPEPPPPDQDQNQQQPQSQDQNEKQDSPSEQRPQDQKDASPSENSKDGSPPPDKNSPQPPESQPNSGTDPSQPKEQSQPPPSSAFGDMSQEKPDRPPERPEPAPSERTQQVGGKQQREMGTPEADDPRLAMPLQKLDQLRQQDSPAKLFQILEGKPGPAPAQKGKTW
jgi:Ca-activated chloride channel homolog